MLMLLMLSQTELLFPVELEPPLMKKRRPSPLPYRDTHQTTASEAAATSRPSRTTSARCSGLGTTKRRTELDCHLLSVQREYSERRSVRTASEAGSMAGEVVGTM